MTPPHAVLITGANSGIGAATAQLFVERGHRVYGGCRSEAAAAQLRSIGCQPVELDVTVGESMRAAVDAIEQDDLAVGVLVNCAGYSQGGPLEELPLAALRGQFEVNVIGMLAMTQFVLPGMRRNGTGRIINLSSVAGRITMAGMGAYSMSKHAVEAQTCALRYELAGTGIDVVTIQPGGVATPFGQTETRLYHHGARGGPYERFTERVVARLNDNPMQLAPATVARTIHRAAVRRHPRRTYRVGALAKVMLGLHDVLPRMIWDRLITSAAPVP